MEITNELLRKYSNNELTGSERAVVELWLETSKPEGQEMVFRAGVNAGGDMFQAVRERITSADTRRQRSRQLWRYAAAACLAIGMIGIGWYQNAIVSADNQLSLDNLSGQHTKDFNSDSGLVFRLSAHSKAHASLTNTINSISFCGAMEVTNRSTKDIRIVFSSTCKTRGIAEHTITCKPGKSYVALHDPMEENEIIIINRNMVNELPGSVVI
ncbi:hypothetical protein DSL64_21930 [Dyadobacter luteus]|jgi:hypothetical protein|uniref:Uncharacterized protein n=1 Tax=Dyadobacter luteus TaxID=2259619 RepID=A0A3D8Y955_9BACT|nr:hypothetical protein [Dyadobacter luteus]REA58047.1 hypothetical protein DSL64_21930 [Dyadobacter luteus]